MEESANMSGWQRKEFIILRGLAILVLVPISALVRASFRSGSDERVGQIVSLVVAMWLVLCAAWYERQARLGR